MEELARDAEGSLDGVGDAVGGVGWADAPAAGAGEGFEVFGGVVHQDGGAGDFQHGDVVPVVADGEDLCGVDAVGGGEREDGGAFGAAGGEDVEDGEIAGGIFGAVEGDDGFAHQPEDRGQTPLVTMKLSRMGHPCSEAAMVLPERPEGWPEAEMPGCSSRRASARAMRSMVPQSMAWMGAS